MPQPIVAIVGRPNVGKSTLVNRIAQVNDAIVHEMRGVTRDRSYHSADWNGVDFALVDTGGIELATDDDFQASIRAQAFRAADEADAIIFLVDGRTGIQADDEEVARILLRSKAPAFLAVNKMDTPGGVDDVWEYWQLGMGQPWAISALHGHGTGDLLDEVVAAISHLASTEDEDVEEEIINIAVIGRPNAGKSSLVNRLTNNDRSIVSPVAGTTRDAVDTLIVHNEQKYRIVDTAGLRRKSKIDDSVEYYGFVRAMRAIDRADVALLVMDSTLGVTNEDQRVANYAAERGCAMVVVLNKWDIVVGAEAKLKVREDVQDELKYIDYAPVVALSALTGKNALRLWDAIDEAYANYSATISTSKLNTWLAEIRESGHTVTKGKTVLRIKYVTQTSACPPDFAFFCNRPDVVTDNYIRFLENRLRREFSLVGTPIRFRFKKKD
ncbi:ribosome biogenesis GTPase Der [Adlercreutzia sp. ZJ304]|uniref:ribosome biogenesis GTPase Der n=1 Tax=Adlercreutzia sp. ZJ304 TaxID=2709791 RepID=UPI0013EC9054|nr:ribosome biogenesis GTPase Der [Adlercreutzia sp. ZJ304]